MKRWLVYGLAGVVVLLGGVGALYWWVEEDYQRCADALRQDDMFTIAQMVEDYHDITDRYPFQPTDGSEVEALLASRDLTEEERRGPAERPMTILDKDAFYDELERVLGPKEVKRRTDPQKVAVTAPNFYQYHVTKDGYSVSVNLYNAVPQSRELGPHYHKLQVGSFYLPDQKIYPFLEISVNSILAASQAVGERCR